MSEVTGVEVHALKEKRGKIVAIVTPPASPKKIDPHEFLDCLHGTVIYAPDWDQPLGEDDWEACR